MLEITTLRWLRHTGIRDFARRLMRPIIAMACLLVVLSMADALATLRLINSGCEEVNPAMRWLLTSGNAAFFIGKMTLTFAGAFIILAFRNHRLFVPGLRVRYALPVLAGVYACLNIYEVVLLVTTY